MRPIRSALSLALAVVGAFAGALGAALAEEASPPAAVGATSKSTGEPAAADSFCPTCRRAVTWEQERCHGCGEQFEPLRPRVRKGEGAKDEPAPEPAGRAGAGARPTDESPFERARDPGAKELGRPHSQIIQSPWQQIQPPEHSRFGFGSYGRVGFNLDTDLSGAKQVDIADYRPRLDKGPYQELHFFYKDHVNDLPILVKSTLAFDEQLFPYDGDWDARMTVRELYAEVEPLEELALWVGARMYRGDQVYLFDFWPLDDQNTLGGGAAVRLGEVHRIQAHVGVNRILDESTFFQYQEVELPLSNAVGTREAVFLDRHRGVASLAYALELPVGVKGKLYTEGHYLPPGWRELTPSGIEEHLPADHGFLIGGQLGLFSDDGFLKGSFANLFTTYATGLAAYDELAIPFGFDTELQVTDSRKLLVALGGALETPYAGAHFGLYWQSFTDSDDVDDTEDREQLAAGIRPMAYIGDYFRAGFEFTWQGVQHHGIFPETGEEEFMEVMKFSILLGVAPRPSLMARPELLFFYSFKWLNQATRYELGRTRFAEDPEGEEQSFGLLAEWWF